MKILYVTTARIPTEKAHGAQIMKMCEALAELGHEVELVVPGQPNGLTEDPFVYYGVAPIFSITYLKAAGFRPYDKIGYWLHRLTFAVAAMRLAWKRRADLLYTRDELIAVFASCGFGPFVFEVHEGRWNVLMRRAAAASARLVVLTAGLSTYFHAHGVPLRKIVIAPDAIDLEDFQDPESREAARTRLGVPLDASLVLYIGRIDEWKGTDTFFAAAEFFPAGVTATVIGGSKEQVEQLRSRYPHVLFLGFRPYRELADNQAAADLLILPNSGKHAISVRDTSPLKLFSYMASGKPVIASDLPSLREVLDAETAAFFTPDDPRDLARAVRDTLADPAAALRRAAVACEKVRQYSWRARAERILTSLLDSASVR